MATTLAVPDQAIEYILYQRTLYLSDNPIFQFLSKLGNTFPALYKPSVKLKSRLFQEQLKTAYANDMLTEYQQIRTYLPSKASAILDIGCGVAGIDVHLFNHYPNKPTVCLLDKTQVEEQVFYQFHQHAAFYNSLTTASNLLNLNKIPKKYIKTQEATPDNQIEFKHQFDLIVSLISWGYHYPVETYLDQTLVKLRKSGRLIIDLRKNTAGKKVLKKHFGTVDTISQTPKSIRVCCYH